MKEKRKVGLDSLECSFVSFLGERKREGGRFVETIFSSRRVFRSVKRQIQTSSFPRGGASPLSFSIVTRRWKRPGWIHRFNRRHLEISTNRIESAREERWWKFSTLALFRPRFTRHRTRTRVYFDAYASTWNDIVILSSSRPRFIARQLSLIWEYSSRNSDQGLQDGFKKFLHFSSLEIFLEKFGRKLIGFDAAIPFSF